MGKTNSYKKISIITPSYNQAQFLERTILSVIGQNYPNLEYIIIDGGSTDNSVNIIKKYKNYIDYWISEPDKGQSDAINKGLKMATGEILHWINSDDMLMPGALFLINDYFDNHPDVGCVIGDLEVIDENDNRLMTRKSIPFHFYSALFTCGLVPQPSSPFTQQAWLQAGPLDINLQYQMDFEFYLRMYEKGVKFGLLPKPLAKFRMHSDSKTVAEYENKVQIANKIIQKKYINSKYHLLIDKDIINDILKFVFKIFVYIRRMLLRKDIMPLQKRFAVKKIEK